jgi:hypothetical protein
MTSEKTGFLDPLPDLTWRWQHSRFGKQFIKQLYWNKMLRFSKIISWKVIAIKSKTNDKLCLLVLKIFCVTVLYSGRDASFPEILFYILHNHDSCLPLGDCGGSRDWNRDCCVTTWYQAVDLTTELPHPRLWATTSPTMGYHVPRNKYCRCQCSRIIFNQALYSIDKFSIITFSLTTTTVQYSTILRGIENMSKCFFIVFYPGRDASQPWDYTVMFPGPVQETVGAAGFELGTAASSVLCRPVDLTIPTS